MSSGQRGVPSGHRLPRDSSSDSFLDQSRQQCGQGEGGCRPERLAQEEEGPEQRRCRKHHSLLNDVAVMHAAQADEPVLCSRSGRSLCSTGVNVKKHSNEFHKDLQGFEASSNSPCQSLPLPTFQETPEQPFSFLSMIESFLHISSATPTGLRSFLQSSMQPARIVHRAASRGSDLWPCPIPAWCWTAYPRPSPARRRRRKFHRLRAQVLQSVIGVLNWECLGHPTRAPPNACVGSPFSDAQWDMVCRLERLVDHFLRPGSISSSSLGRSGEKFSTLLRAVQELPEVRDVDLEELVSCISRDLDPYSKPSDKVDASFSRTDAAREQVDPLLNQSQGSCSVVQKDPEVLNQVPVSRCKLPSSVAKPVIASRIKWEHSPQFDPIPFLHDKIVRDAFIDPSRVRLPEKLWSHKPRGKVHCQKSELLKLAEKWDSKGACKMFRKDEISFEESVGIFAVPKDSQWDRLILNPQTANGRLQQFSHFTKELAPGSMFCLLRLEPHQMVRISADDLAEMYYTIKVPEARAKRNSVGCLFDADELAHLQCFNRFRHHGPCVIALSALAMGDSWAVEFAQQSHHNVLRFLAGSMLEHQRVAYRKPFPRSSFLEWLAIDDHIGVQVVTFDQFKLKTPLRDTEVFSRAEEAYKTVGLVQHPKKKQREATEGIFLGAEIDGVEGIVSSPRHRVGALMLCTVLVAKKGHTTPRLLSSLLGCWINVLMFRRPLFAILSHVFSAGVECKQDEVFKLDQQSRNELLALALLGPVCSTDLRVDVAPCVYSTDASPDGGGICVASEEPQVVGELWRHCEQRGYYTQLLNPAATLLAELNLEHLDEPLPEHDPRPLDQVVRVPPPLAEGYLYDCIELFRGEGNWSLCHERAGLRVHPGMDIRGSKVLFLDLNDDSVFHQLVSLALRRSTPVLLARRLGP